MKRDFEGAEINTNYNTTDKGDGDSYGGDLTVGGNFGDDRGNAVLHASYFNRDGLLAGARDFTRVALSDGSLIGAPGTTFPGGSSSIPGLRAVLGSLGNVKFDGSGQHSLYDAATDAYNFAPDNYLQVPQERYLVFGKARFEVNENFRPYVEAQFINNKVASQLAPTPIGNTTPGVSSRGGLQIHVYSPFLSAASAAALQAQDTDANGYVTPTGSWGRRMSEMGPRINDDDRSAYRILGGIEGDVTADWAYDLSYMFARTSNTQGQGGNIAISRFLAGTRTGFMNAAGVVQATPWNTPGLANNGAGELVCADAGARQAGCVPVNIYGEGNVSGEAVDYMKIGTINGETAETKMASLIFTNPNLVDLWGAGPIGLAAGAEWREEYGRNQTDEYLASGDVAGFNPSDPTEGMYRVTELLSEITVPLLKDVFMAESLEFNGAFRFSDYSNAVGSAETWAAGMQWTPVQGLTFRGQYQRAIRGPSVAELFLGQTVSFDGAVDPCQAAAAAAPGALRDRCIATGVPAAVVGTNYSTGGTSFPAIQGGNPDLFEETADTYTIGFVMQPSFAPNLIATIDYYNIKIDDVITTGVGTQNLVDGCYDFGVANLCNQIVRTAAGEFESFSDTNINAATLETEGVDLDVGYDFDLGFGLPNADGSQLKFRLYGTYVLNNDYIPINGLPIINECAGAFGRSCGAPDPEWRHSLRTTWRHLGEVEDDDPTFVYGIEKFSSQDYFDVAFSWEFNDSLRLNVGVDNVLNEEPELGASTQQGGNVEQSNTYPTVYDVLGRAWWATVSLKL
jgi:iron complex outermembrane receptor protein